MRDIWGMRSTPPAIAGLKMEGTIGEAWEENEFYQVIILEKNLEP